MDKILKQLFESELPDLRLGQEIPPPAACWQASIMVAARQSPQLTRRHSRWWQKMLLELQQFSALLCWPKPGIAMPLVLLVGVMAAHINHHWSARLTDPVVNDLLNDSGSML
ncbi:MAG: hypothetical protein ACK5WY_04900 [Holosporaceae bacterium]